MESLAIQTTFQNPTRRRLSRIKQDTKLQKEQSLSNLIKSSSLWNITLKQDKNCFAWDPSLRSLNGTKPNQNANSNRNSKAVMSGRLIKTSSQTSSSSSTSSLYMIPMINLSHMREVSIEFVISNCSKICLKLCQWIKSHTCWLIKTSINLNQLEKLLRDVNWIMIGRSFLSLSLFLTLLRTKAPQWPLSRIIIRSEVKSWTITQTDQNGWSANMETWRSHTKRPYKWRTFMVVLMERESLMLMNLITAIVEEPHQVSMRLRECHKDNSGF